MSLLTRQGKTAASPPAPADRPAGQTSTAKNPRPSLTPYLLLLPALTALLLFVYGPALLSLIGSFFVIPLSGGSWKYAGFNNYLKVFADPLIHQAAWNTLVYSLATIIPSIVLGLLLALLMEKMGRGSWLAKTALILPMTANMVAMAVVFKWIFAFQGGFANQILGIAGLAPVNWLDEADTSLFTVILLGLWRATSLCMLLFMAGLTTIPSSIHEAAAVEGIRGLTKLRTIILPMLRPTVVFVTVLSITGAVQVFEIVNVMTKGGPLGSSETAMTAAHKVGFEYFRIGEASAISFILIALLLVVGIIGRQRRTKESS
ncbi:sugar ABC transporter permease [Arthrobacter sp. PGP41]|uniref:carbohydrate ABC transporter permease n=1 Tax=Arthrobacter sp. PGP41 TaxID=2079227 RepID=UPI000CDBAB26|nr:sugar ABC transporter permease [Arthrobacter sp. PGP41]AUZ34670.1 sugar ABC transporter permease [Arthrobacter sp. PGP41]